MNDQFKDAQEGDRISESDVQLISLQEIEPVMVD